jgi:hypothetical protein
MSNLSLNLSSRLSASLSTDLSDLFSGALQAAAGYPVIDLSRYSVDPSSGKVLRFYDSSNLARWFEQTDPAKQVAVPAPSAAGPGLWASFAGGQYYDSNQPASFWTYQSDGSGMSDYCLLRPAAYGCLFGTTSNATQGVRAYINPVNWVGIEYYDAVTTPVLGVAAAVFSPSVTEVYRFSYSESLSPKYRVKVTSSALSTGGSTSAPSALAPTTTMRIGANPNSASPLSALVSAFLFLGPYSATADAAVMAWLATRGGVP